MFQAANLSVSNERAEDAGSDNQAKQKQGEEHSVLPLPKYREKGM